MITFSDTPSERADIILVYGESGLGKTTFALGAPDPVLMSLEGGEAVLVRRGVIKPVIMREGNATQPQTWVQALSWLETYSRMSPGKRPGKWLVIDGLSKLWELSITDLLSRHKEWKSGVAHLGYNRGERAAFDNFKPFTSIIDGIASQGIGVILVAHATLAADRMPQSATEDPKQWVPALQCRNDCDMSRYITNMSDVALFFMREALVATIGSGDRPTKHAAVGSGRIIVRTKKGHGFLAKSRYPDVPDPIELSPDPREAWERFWSCALESADQIRADCRGLLDVCPAEKRVAAEAALGAAKDLSALRAVRARLRLTVEKENGDE